jgi:hypothetical protein
VKKNRFTEEQISFALKQAETGRRWRRSFGGWDLGADILPLEEALCRVGHRRAAASEEARGREP